MGAMSEGCPMRPRGVMAINCFSVSPPTPITHAARAPSVAVAPGLIEFTRIFFGPSSFAPNSTDIQPVVQISEVVELLQSHGHVSTVDSGECEAVS